MAAHTMYVMEAGGKEGELRQGRDLMYAKEAIPGLGKSWPAAFLDSKATDGIIIARGFWQQGAPRGKGGPGLNHKKGHS